MPHAYSVAVNITTGLPTPVQIDVFELLSGSAKRLCILAWEFEQTSELGDAQEEQLSFVLKRVTGAPTTGSGGGTPTFNPLDPGSPAVSATVKTGNTTKLTGGTSLDIARFAWNVRGPFLYVPVPEERPILDATTRFVLELLTTPADAITSMVGRLSILEY